MNDREFIAHEEPGPFDIGAFIQRLTERWAELQPSPYAPVELPSVPRGFTVCECGAPAVWVRERSFTHGTTQETTAAYIRSVLQCLRIYWHP